MGFGRVLFQSKTLPCKGVLLIRKSLTAITIAAAATAFALPAAVAAPDNVTPVQVAACSPCGAKKAGCGAKNPCAIKKAACGAKCAAKKAGCGACGGPVGAIP